MPTTTQVGHGKNCFRASDATGAGQESKPRQRVYRGTAPRQGSVRSGGKASSQLHHRRPGGAP
eukprot:94895-Rhodomonas_salina.1